MTTKTLEAAIAWSYDLLPPNEQRVLRQLSVFSGSFEAHAAAAVAGDGVLPPLGRLVDASLVAVDLPRYRLLVTVRTFARDRLRELGEETGLGMADVALVGEHPDWTVYEWPIEVARDDARIGQAHRWFFFRPLRDDLAPTPDGEEFSAWQWADPEWLIGQVVEFRQEPYRQVLGAAGG